MRKWIAVLMLAATACQPSLKNHARLRSFGASPVFDDGSSARPRPDCVVPYGPAPRRPALSRAVLERGRDRYEIHCQVCHGLDGDGQGMAVSRGFPRPPTFHSAHSRALSPDDVFDVISDGRGLMFPMKNRLSAEDRWAVAAYVGVLQRHRHFPRSALTAADRAALAEAKR